MSKNVLELKWTDIEEVDKEKTVVFLGIAPIEEHGRHLPIGVDIYETTHWMNNSINKLENVFSDYIFLMMPIIPYGNAYMKGFVGNIHLSQKMLYHLVLDSLAAIAQWGIKNIVIISGHADPKHLIAIEQACEVVNKKYGKIAFSPMGAIFSEKVSVKPSQNTQNMYDKLKEYPDDYHAGWIETSCMLSINEQLVNPNYKEQPSIHIKDQEMMFPRVLIKRIKDYGHIGYPSEATVELGNALNEDMAEKIKICVEAFIQRVNYQQYEHHELYRLPFLKVRKWRWI